MDEKHYKLKASDVSDQCPNNALASNDNSDKQTRSGNFQNGMVKTIRQNKWHKRILNKQKCHNDSKRTVHTT